MKPLIGEWDFHNLQSIKCRAPTLIPRPETEDLVEIILSNENKTPWCTGSSIGKGHSPPFHFIDIGGGTGAIGLALLKAWPHARCTTIDISRAAVELTLENACVVGVEDRIQVVHSPIGDFTPPSNMQYDMIVSNPPYILSKDMCSLDPCVKNHEDHRALDGGDDGLTVVREIITFARRYLKREGNIWLELDLSHPSMLKSMGSKILPQNGDCELPIPQLAKIYNDFTGRERFAQFVFRGV
jgi:release factor glutamine methyltransferase